MERDTVSPLAKLQQCMGILMVSFKLPDNHKILLIKKFLQSKQIQSWLMFYSRVVLAQFGFMKWEKKKKNVLFGVLCFIYLPELLWWPSMLKFYGIKWKLFILPRLQYPTEANHPILHLGLSVNRSVIRYNLRKTF